MKRATANFAEVVRVVCRRPHMYMMHGTFGEALAYLDGYAIGRKLGRPGRSGSFFSHFKKWLAAKLDMKRNEHFWTNFRDRYGDDQTALNHFAEFWAEYEATRDEVEL